MESSSRIREKRRQRRPQKDLFIIRALRKETRDTRQTAIELFYRIEGTIRYPVFHTSLARNI